MQEARKMAMPKRSIREHTQDEYDRAIEKIAAEMQEANPDISLPDHEPEMIRRLQTVFPEASYKARWNGLHRWILGVFPEPLVKRRIPFQEHEERLLQLGALRMKSHKERFLAYFRAYYDDITMGQANSAVAGFERAYQL
jgi:hypothetical protein